MVKIITQRITAYYKDYPVRNIGTQSALTTVYGRFRISGCLWVFMGVGLPDVLIFKELYHRDLFLKISKMSQFFIKKTNFTFFFYYFKVNVSMVRYVPIPGRTAC